MDRYMRLKRMTIRQAVFGVGLWLALCAAPGFCMDDSPYSGARIFLSEARTLCDYSQELWEKGDMDSAMEALDRAYGLIGRVNEGKNRILARRKESLRFKISKRILEIHTSRRTGPDIVAGAHDEIPLEMNRHIRSELDAFTRGREKGFFKRAWRRSGKYREHIVRKLDAAGMPSELSWLPLIESGFRPNALSEAKALGLWQFIRTTGAKYGLKRNRYIDERLDPYKSTDAAIKYLSRLHEIFGDWNMALAAYNCGEGRVLREIKRRGKKYFDNFWDIYERLPRETARYVPRFLATLHIVKNPAKYGLDPARRASPPRFEIVSVPKRIRLKDAAFRMGISEKVLTKLNPSLRARVVPAENYPLKVPPGKAGILAAGLDRIRSVKYFAGGETLYHRIRPGETLSGIARRHRVSVRKIASANGIRVNSVIVAGRKLKIPGGGETFKTYLVKDGDTPFEIALKHNMTLSAFLRINGLSKRSKIYPGQRLLVV